MPKTVNDLREALFDTISELRAGKIDIQKAKAISEAAQVIINSAKVETEHLRVTGGKKGSGFIPEPAIEPLKPGTPALLSEKGYKGRLSTEKGLC